MTSIAPRHWLIAFIIAVAAHLAAGAAIWIFDNASAPPVHSPRGVMVSLDALTIGNSEAQMAMPQPVTPIQAPSSQPDSASMPQQPESVDAPSSPAAPAAAQPVAPEPVAPDNADAATQDSADGADIPVAQAVTVQSADTLQAVEQAPAVTARQPEVATPADQGSGAHGLSDDPTVTYIAHIRSWLGQHKYYPQAARESGAEGTVRLYIVIDRGGHVLNVSVARSSGNTALDQAAMDMVKRAEPLPTMPDNLLRTRLAIILPVDYGLAPQPDAVTGN